MATELPSLEGLSTEDKILRAANHVFVRQGYAGARTRDIAEVAGINVATLHYYYRTKEALYERIVQGSVEEFSALHREVFYSDRPLRETIKLFVERYIDLFRRKPYLAMFCMSESERNPESFVRIADFRLSDEFLSHQLEELHRAGEIRKISVGSFISAMVGFTVFPFMAKQTMIRAMDMTDEDFEALLDEQKQIIPEMIIGYLWKNASA